MTVKKALVLILIIAAIVLFGMKYGCRDFWIPGVIQTINKSIESKVDEAKEETEKLEKGYLKQIESAEKVGTSYERLGRLYAEQGNWTPAIDALTKALQYGNTKPEIHFLLGGSYANRGKETNNKNDIDLGEKHYNQALEKNPSMYRARYGLGMLNFYLKDNKQKGIEIMREIIKERRDSYEARFALGLFYYETREVSRALSVYEDLHSDLKKLPDSPDIKAMMENCQANITRIMAELASTGSGR